MRAHDQGQSDYEVVFLQFKKAQLAGDLDWLETLERLWPSPCPPQDHVEIMYRFAQEFIAWRHGVIAPNDAPPSTAENTVFRCCEETTASESQGRLVRRVLPGRRAGCAWLIGSPDSATFSLLDLWDG
jgi:hypothetical protein